MKFFQVTHEDDVVSCECDHFSTFGTVHESVKPLRVHIIFLEISIAFENELVRLYVIVFFSILILLALFAFLRDIMDKNAAITVIKLLI